MRKINPVIARVIEYVHQNGRFHGSPTRLVEVLGYKDMSPSSLIRFISKEGIDWLEEADILFTSGRDGMGRWVNLSPVQSSGEDAEEHDGEDISADNGGSDDSIDRPDNCDARDGSDGNDGNVGSDGKDTKSPDTDRGSNEADTVKDPSAAPETSEPPARDTSGQG